MCSIFHYRENVTNLFFTTNITIWMSIDWKSKTELNCVFHFPWVSFSINVENETNSFFTENITKWISIGWKSKAQLNCVFHFPLTCNKFIFHRKYNLTRRTTRLTRIKKLIWVERYLIRLVFSYKSNWYNMKSLVWSKVMI
jgi:hypothetical protein